MSLTRVHSNLCTNLVRWTAKNGKRRYTVPTTMHSEITETPQYPPIYSLSLEERRKRNIEAWCESIKKLNTVEEKLFKINMPKYYGWMSYSLKEGTIPYNALSQAQYITKTHIINEPGLPSYYDNVMTPAKLDKIVQDIKSRIEDVIIFEYTARKRENELLETDLSDPVKLNNIMSEAVTRQVNRILQIELSLDLPHLLEVEVDYEPRIEAFWVVGNINPPIQAVRNRKKNPFMRKFANDPINRNFQYKGQPIFQLRHNLPLNEIIPSSESENPALDIPTFRLDPKVLGYNTIHCHGTNIPGFWPGDSNEFGILSYHNRSYLLNRPVRFKDELDALKVQAMMASYSWLLGQACYQGFSTFNDVTYPFVAQTIITDGQWWSFCAYQLNTVLVHAKNIDEVPKKNICWITEPMKLYDKIEDGKLHGFNDDVLKHLIKFYANVPQERIGVNMKPYLGETEKVIADIENPEKREWLERQYKHLVSNRPRHRLIPEIYNWQWIYLINHKTRPMDKKREKWEYGINPFSRKYNDHHPRYIPKIYRPNVPKRMFKWENTYYP